MVKRLGQKLSALNSRMVASYREKWHMGFRTRGYCVFLSLFEASNRCKTKILARLPTGIKYSDLTLNGTFIEIISRKMED